METEVWKDVAGWEGKVKVSSFGNTLVCNEGVWEEPKFFHSSNDYFAFTYEKAYFAVHVAVCEAFHGKRPEGMVVDHIDEDRVNNHYKNLRWVTQSENNKKAYLKRVTPLGRNHPTPVVQFSLDGTYMETFPTVSAASKAAKCAKAGITQCCSPNRPRYKKYGGYKWMYLRDYEDLLLGVAK